MQQYAVQRRFDRHVLSVPLEVRRKPPHAPAPVPGLTMEISESGFSAMLSDALEVGETVTAMFEVPAAGRVSIDAVVRNKNLFRYGFELTGSDGQARGAMKQACESLPPYEGGWY